MALNIRNRETDRLATELARQTGETKTEAVTTALRERLARVERRRTDRRFVEDLTAIADRAAALPVLDPRTPEEIIGYDEHGLPS